MGQSETIIPEKIFFKIGEVCDLLDVQAHVLRYWETEFPMLSPQKNKSGQRTYRRRDVEIALKIKDLLYEELYTIAGAKKRLQSGGRELKTATAQPAKEVKPGEQPSLIDIRDTDSEAKSQSKKESSGALELDGERKDALKSLASQLLELREILKTDQSGKTEGAVDDSKRV